MITGKSYEGFVLGLYRGLFEDIVVSFPKLRKDSDRDYKRLLSLVKTRGLRFVLEDLPSAGKLFDKSLAACHLSRFSIPGFGLRRKSRIPRLFKGLWNMVFHDNGCIRLLPSRKAISFLRQLLLMFKGFLLPCPKKKEHESVAEFIDTDLQVRSPCLTWHSDRLDPGLASNLRFGDLERDSRVLPARGAEIDPAGDVSLEVLQQVADAICLGFQEFTPFEYKPKHGPGAVSEGPIHKYRFPSWPDRLDTAFPIADLAFANYDQWMRCITDEDWIVSLTEDEPYSRLLCVPKTYKGPRLIAAEPTAHQWCQQILLRYLMKQVENGPLARCISFRDQSANARLARAASATGSHATIDLSSASDRISCWVIERLFRRSPSLLEGLFASRTRVVHQVIDKKQPEIVNLRKFSTMGSAVTFPVQSILFAIIAISATILTRGDRFVSMKGIASAAREVQVFGDDIIVPDYSWDWTMALLTTLGLKVNHDKTFGTGKFRESCGCDAYDGTDVTKVLIKRMPHESAPGSILSAIDSYRNLTLRGFESLARTLRSLTPQGRRYPIPEVNVDSGLVGWAVFGEPDNSHIVDRWNPFLHRREHLVIQAEKAVSRRDSDQETSLLQYFIEAAGQPEPRGDRLGHLVKGRSLKVKRAWANILN